MKRITLAVASLVLLLGAAALVQAQQGGADPNSFNRLMSRGEACNQPPSEDGIHDPSNPGTQQLQSPVVAFEPLPSDDPKQRRPDITQAKEKLGWEPTIKLEEGLKRTIPYFDKLLSESK